MTKVLKVLKFPAATTLHQLEYYHVNHDKEGVKPYLEDGTDPMKLLNPHIYWRYFATPEVNLLKKLADTVFVALTSASICETNFRDFEYIMSKRRLRLQPDLTEKLVFIYCNKRIRK